MKINVQQGAGVHVTSPANNATDRSPVNFVAAATTDCPTGVASMGIYTAPYQLAYTVGGASLGASQALEFDVNQFFGGMGFTWGHECRIAGGNEWDVWNDAAGKWVPTGIPCNPSNNTWNHLVIQVQRTSDNELTYQSITLNGRTHVLNWTYSPFSAPGWYGITVNYQMDGNYKQTPYTVYVDKLNFTYE